MQIIAISMTGLEDVIGDIMVVGVMVNELSFGKMRNYWNKNKLGIRLYRGILFEKVQNDMATMIIRRTRDKKLIPELIMDILNSYKKFWKYPIYIESPYDEEIVDLMQNRLPHNLKVINLNLKDCKFKFTPHKSLALAWAIATEYKFQETEINKKIWGDYGMNKIDCPKTKKFLEEHSDCPFIRTEFKEVENEKKI